MLYRVITSNIHLEMIFNLFFWITFQACPKFHLAFTLSAGGRIGPHNRVGQIMKLFYYIYFYFFYFWLCV